MMCILGCCEEGFAEWIGWACFGRCEGLLRRLLVSIKRFLEIYKLQHVTADDLSLKTECQFSRDIHTLNII